MPRSIIEEMNQSLESKEMEEEVHHTFHSMNKGKSLGLDLLLVELYLSFMSSLKLSILMEDVRNFKCNFLSTHMKKEGDFHI